MENPTQPKDPNYMMMMMHTLTFMHACMNECEETDLSEIFRGNTREVEAMDTKEEESKQRKDRCDVKPMTRHGFGPDLDSIARNPTFPVLKTELKRKEPVLVFVELNFPIFFVVREK